MTKIVNLRTRRKQAAREAARAAASHRTAAAGANRVMREFAAARRASEEARLDGHRIEGPEPELPDENKKEG